MPPLVSVVIPAYNAADFIDASLDSALSQTLKDIEVIVVDDGSTDSTAERVRARQDPRLRLITQPNGGNASARNKALNAARGVYLGFIDADDVWLPAKLSRHVAELGRRPEIDVTFSWVDAIGPAGERLGTPCPRWRGVISFEQLLCDFAIRTTSAVVMRRRAAEEAGAFDATFLKCVDFEFFLRVALLRRDNTLAIPEVLTLYRRHPSQITQNWRRMRDGWVQALASMRNRTAIPAAVERRAASNIHRYFATLAYESGDFGEALTLMRRAFALAPAASLIDRRNWIAASAALAGIVLPRSVLEKLERTAGFHRPA